MPVNSSVAFVSVNPLEEVAKRLTGETPTCRTTIAHMDITPREILKLGGTHSKVRSNYKRLFPELPPNGATIEGLIALGEAMRDCDPPVSAESEPDLPLAGYTYLGQFIDHDLTLDLTPLELAGPNVEETRNFRTPFLDLDHLYGGGPNLAPFLYEKGRRYRERLLVGKNAAPSERCDDLPRNSQGLALTGDPRQDENLLLAQLHVGFLKLHNAIVDSDDEMAASPHYKRDGESPFAVAQRVLRWHYQWIVKNDFLPAVLHPTIVELLPALEKQVLATEAQDFRIPVEFSGAAFRFGHSLVRDEYKTGVNTAHSFVTLTELLCMTGTHGGASPALPEAWIVEWQRFFDIPSLGVGQVNRSRKIDTQIANGLHDLDRALTKLYNVQVPGTIPRPQLPVRTLLRGARMALPSGEAVAQAVAARIPWVRRLTEAEIVGGPHEEVFTDRRYSLRGNTPLWYYILREAEVRAESHTIGPIGSYIIAIVILTALVSDPDSHLSVPEWEPTLDGRRRPSMGGLLYWAAQATAGATGRSST